MPDPIPRPAFELPFRLGGIASTWEIPGLLALVGQADHCQFVLNDDSVSRTHACLVRTPMGTWVVDMAARDGVYVNGTRVRWAWLADGDIVRFGRFTMVVRYDRQPDGIGRDDVPLEAGASLAEPHDDRPEDDLEPTGGEGRGLALRPVAPAGGGEGPGPAPAGSPHGAGHRPWGRLGACRRRGPQPLRPLAAADAAHGVVPQRHGDDGPDVHRHAPRVPGFGPRGARAGAEPHPGADPAERAAAPDPRGGGGRPEPECRPAGGTGTAVAPQGRPAPGAKPLPAWPSGRCADRIKAR